MSFVHLHNHSHYSILSALAKPKEYLSLAKEYGMPAVAITDNGVTYGLIEFYKLAKKEGIKPILGMEAYIAPMGHRIKTPENRHASIVLLAENNEGYHNLLKLSTFASLDGFYYKPRIDDDLLRKYSRGLIALSGSLNGVIAKPILENEIEKAKERIRTYQSIFGKNSFFLEMQHHPEIANWSIVNQKLLELGREMNAPLLAANDCHYAKTEDADAHDVLICIQGGKSVKDPHRFKFSGNYSLRSAEDMLESFRFCKEATENTLRIAERCNVELQFGENKIPSFDTGNKSPKDYLRELCEKGLIERYGNEAPREVIDRLNYELEVINKMGFDTYFLIVHDFVDYAKKQGIVVGPGRGSAAGALIAYCLNITELDPLEHGLLFERFLNPERISMPDIDIDFADTRRDEVLNYVSQKYGEDHVAQIITFGTLAPKAAIRDAGRALGYSYAEVDVIAKTVPDAIFGKYAPLNISIREDPALSKIYSQDPHAKEILDTASKLEGTIRQVGTHACAVIISREALVENTALQRATGNKEGVITQYSMKPLEELGLLKMDFLGLKNLSIMETTLGILKRTKENLHIDLGRLPMDDHKTYKLLQSGQTTGVFQLESAGMKRYLRELKPTEFGDLVAMVSLYRPGPMQFISNYIDGKHGKKKVEYLHKSLESILKSTYGIAIYQEQILEIARIFAGFSLGEADLLRRAIGKKIASELAAQREKFIHGAMKKGHNKTLAVKMFDEVIEPFAGYGFNKSHAACYALIAYQTAYLKAHYPAEFMAALLTADAENTDRIVIEIEECRHLGIDVLAPSINESRAHFTVIDDHHIRFGLTAVKGIGEGPVRQIIAAREVEGAFVSIENFARRVPAKVLNKKTIEALSCSGALDELGERAQLAASYDEISTYAKNIQNSVSEGQTDIFGMMDQSETPDLKLAKVETATQAQKLKWEKDFLGLYVSGHPLQGLKKYISGKSKLIRNLSSHLINKNISVTGMIAQNRRVMTKKAKYMCFGEIEDPTARIPFVLFPRAYEEFGKVVEPDQVVTIQGKLSKRGDDLQIIVEKLKVLSLDRMIQRAKEIGEFDENERILGVLTHRSIHEKHKESENGKGPFIIEMNEECHPETVHQIKALLEANKGDMPVEIHMLQADKLKRIKVPFGIKVSREFKEKLEKLLVA